MLGKRLPQAFVMELGRFGSDDLPDDLSGDVQLPANLLDRLFLNKKRPANLGDRFHNQHSNLGLPKSRRPLWTLSPGVPIGCKSPQKRGPYSMLIHTRVTGFRPKAVIRYLSYYADGGASPRAKTRNMTLTRGSLSSSELHFATMQRSLTYMVPLQHRRRHHHCAPVFG